MSAEERRGKVETSIAIVVSFDGYSASGYKTAIQRSDGSRDTWMREVVLSKGGTTCIPVQYLKEMFETSGRRAIEATKEIGDEHGKT